MTETVSGASNGRTTAPAPRKGARLRIERVYTTPGVHPYDEVGLAILEPLRELDEVAYLRFASVYRSFSSAADFEKEIAELKRLRPDTSDGGPPGDDAGNPAPS